MIQEFTECGLPELPTGPCVSLVRIYRLQISLADGELNPELQQVMEKNFLWRGVTVDPSVPNITLRFRSVNGYYLSNVRALARLFSQGGVRSRAWEPELFIPKGDAITVEAENQTGAAITTYVNFIGVDLEGAQ